MIQRVLIQNFSPKISDIGNIFYNFALPVKLGLPVKSVNHFYRFLPVSTGTNSQP